MRGTPTSRKLLGWRMTCIEDAIQFSGGGNGAQVGDQTGHGGASNHRVAFNVVAAPSAPGGSGTGSV
jgi:hypothetical protein